MNEEAKEVKLIGNKVTDDYVAIKYMQIKASSSSRKIPFNMSLKRIRQLLATKKCFYSGVELNNIQHDKHQRTFDRLDNTKGYTDDNVVACSHEINQLKDSLTIESIVMFYKGIVKHEKRKRISKRI